MSAPVTRIATIVLSCVVVVGCDSTSDQPAANAPAAGAGEAAHDLHDVPLTQQQIEALRSGIADYSDALARIKSYRDAIRDAIAAGDPPTAHRPLDELDIVLQHLTTVARNSNVARTNWESVNTSAQQLRDLFNQVHAEIDAGAAPDFQARAADVDAAIQRLESIPAEG